MSEDMPLALVVDDEPDIRELIELTLTRMGLSCVSAADLTEARQRLAAHHPAICLTDMRLPDGDGIDLVRHIQKIHPEIPVAVITAHGTMTTAIEALKAGAFDFVIKPVELPALRELVRTALKLSERQGTKTVGAARDALVGESAPMQTLKAMIAKLARSQAPVYISGESGTGKELVARLIHAQGPRADKPFVPVNCGAIPQELMESEFFGHKRGSFTGANADKEGLFQAAEGGTLFLDEVADLPLHMQVKLLRAIQEKAVRPVGAATEIRTNVRLLSATHRDLAALVRELRFREDLYFRLNVIELRVPPLRERTGDIPLLSDYILARLAERGDCDPDTRLSNAAITLLAEYRFPGNVRELENILERAVTLSDGPLLEPESLSLACSTPLDPGRAPDPQEGGKIQLNPLLDNLEKELILDALAKSPSKTEAARLLGISFRQLRYRLKKLQID